METQKYICEWCHPEYQQFVSEHPEECRVRFCLKHNTKTWHAPVTCVELVRGAAAQKGIDEAKMELNTEADE